MKLRFDLSGSQVHSAREYDIASDTAIEFGQVVKMSSALVVPAVAAETSPILGVAAEAHTGVQSDLNPRSNGTKIYVYDSPTAVFGCPVPTMEISAGTTSSITISDLATFADDDLNGGYVRLIEKADSSTNSDPIGTVRRITDFTATGKVLTLGGDALTGAPSSGDIYEVYPPFGFAKGNFDTNILKLVLTATASIPIKVVGRDEITSEVLIEAALHELGNKKA